MDDLQDKRDENTVDSISEIEISKEKTSDNSNSGIRNTQTEKVENETFQGIQTSDSSNKKKKSNIQVKKILQGSSFFASILCCITIIIVAGILTFDISSKQFYKKFVMVLAFSCIGFTVLVHLLFITTSIRFYKQILPFFIQSLIICGITIIFVKMYI
ncbi:hypothetical protein BB560_007162 [Smittium megazygosporum]|uniref:Uncharacterized protein n=1 Tax=Smittium megazygosporum TaxID=133381 RepID=A0A2T9XY99_9FUNG|nr:hypothetical protein BB560_007162 [Smittium megazygosporum]